MHKRTLDIPEKIDPNIILNKTRIVKCMSKVKLVLDGKEKELLGLTSNTKKK